MYLCVCVCVCVRDNNNNNDSKPTENLQKVPRSGVIEVFDASNDGAVCTKAIFFFVHFIIITKFPPLRRIPGLKFIDCCWIYYIVYVVRAYGYVTRVTQKTVWTIGRNASSGPFSEKYASMVISTRKITGAPVYGDPRECTT